jgi:hypothetical protein
MKKRTKLVAIVVATMAALLAFAGVAYGANGAVPGDTLYGFDCALENVGIGDGGLEERLAEAGELMDKGQVDEGLALTAEALMEEQEEFEENGDGDEGDEDGLGRCEALLAAAEAVLANGSEQSLEVRTRVAEKLRWMATAELTGKEYGQAVSRLARGLPLDGEDGEGLTDGEGPDSKNGKEKKNNGKAKGRYK